MLHSFQMKRTVDKEVSAEFREIHAEFFCLGANLGEVEKNFSGVLAEREGKYIGRVILATQFGV